MPPSYEARLRAVGRLADRGQLHSVCVTEIEAGFLLMGLGVTEHLGGVTRSERTLEYSYAEIDALCVQIEGE